MKITYLQHSGFVVELRDVVLIFDYYKGKLPSLDKYSNIYVFASHSHYDHFQKKIFQWVREYQQITYILSDDIVKQQVEAPVISVGIRQEIKVDQLQVKTLRSTDEGVAFLVSVEDKVIYHAGDLNWWHWEEEGPVYNELMKRNYQHEVHSIEGEKIHVAFLPLDGRQNEQYDWGMDYFMDHTDTDYVFPMHMWGDMGVCDRLLEQSEEKHYKDKFMKIIKEGEVFELCV